MKSRVVAWLGLWVALAVAGCSRPGPAEKVAAQPKGYALTGEVLAVDAEKKILKVKHDPIEGLMPAMTMEFAVSAADATAAKAGQRIRARLIPVEQGDWRLEQIWPADATAESEIKNQALALRQDTVSRGGTAYREVGEKMPTFALYDQDGRVVNSARFAGKQIMLNFIYTRCPVATMCPLSTEKMRQVQRLAREAGVKDLELVSVSFDPATDTPAVLKEYALQRGIDTSNFSFLTGPENAIKDLLAQFGVIAEFEGDLIKHNLATLLINDRGTIVHRADGSAWEPKEFVEKMKR